MICPTCGSELNEGLKFCTQCGTPIETEAPVEPVAEVNTAEVIEETPAFEADTSAEAPVFEAAEEPVEQVDAELVEEKPVDKKPMIFGIVALVLGVLGIPSGCCFAFCGGTPFFIATVVMSVIGLISAKKSGNKTALILSIVGIVLAVLILIAIIFGSISGGFLSSMLASGGFYY